MHKGAFGSNDLEAELRQATTHRIFAIARAINEGMSVDRVHELTKIDPWFLNQIETIIKTGQQIAARKMPDPLSPELLRLAKIQGFSDRAIARFTHRDEQSIREQRLEQGLTPQVAQVDTLAAEFPAETNYLYSSYHASQSDVSATWRKKILVLGSGPYRIGSSVEFDWCCVNAVKAAEAEGYETIMVNCNPETVSTDYDVSDRLYFEPITFEDVMEIVALERPDGVIVQLGGQTPLKLARQLEQAGVTLLGTSYDSIDRTEDRKRFAEMVDKLGLNQPTNGIATSPEEARSIGERIGYPVMVRPSYVLGGRAMERVKNEGELEEYFNNAVMASPEHPVLIDKFLEGAVEVDVDVLADGARAIVAGMMEHVELAGVHSGDSACSLPPHNLSRAIQQEIDAQAVALALELGVVGLMNAQFAVKDGEVFLLEVNPRASRTVPFVSKAIGTPLAKEAVRLMIGQPLDPDRVSRTTLAPFAVKETVFPFAKFPGADLTLGPEMKSTGEVMGRGRTFAEAYLKSQIAASNGLRAGGSVFIGVRDEDKASITPIARALTGLGYQVLATPGTRARLMEGGLSGIVETSLKPGAPNSLYRSMADNSLALVINTTRSGKRRIDPTHLRRMVLTYNIPYCTTVEAAGTMVRAMEEMGPGRDFEYYPLLGFGEESPAPPDSTPTERPP
ncbi:MAG: carbamoyl-phosphate synthase large subunit [SAR324 cluster bacterium]|nr:carbamoyl-phosphate synthase large subunit [SAR324 cluster bacterium]